MSKRGVLMQSSLRLSNPCGTQDGCALYALVSCDNSVAVDAKSAEIHTRLESSQRWCANIAGEGTSYDYLRGDGLAGLEPLVCT